MKQTLMGKKKKKSMQQNLFNLKALAEALSLDHSWLTMAWAYRRRNSTPSLSFASASPPAPPSLTPVPPGSTLARAANGVGTGHKRKGDSLVVRPSGKKAVDICIDQC